MLTDKRRIIIKLAPVPDSNLWGGVPVAVRLRKLLKLALRVCGLRAVEVRETADVADAGESSDRDDS